MGAGRDEVIDIYEHHPVQTPPRPLSISGREPLPYSDEAIEGNHWGNALLLAFIDERLHVQYDFFLVG